MTYRIMKSSVALLFLLALLLIVVQSSAPNISSTAIEHDIPATGNDNDANNDNNSVKGGEEILPWSPSFADLEASWEATYFEKDETEQHDDYHDSPSTIDIYDKRELARAVAVAGDDDEFFVIGKDSENKCASQKTCGDCASFLSCHWCEHDQACHAKGSIYGCTTGVDCYSNDRCRREKPEKFHKFVITEIPKSRLILVVSIAAFLIMCCSTCHYCCVVSRDDNNDIDHHGYFALSSRPPDPPSIIEGGEIVGIDGEGTAVEQDEEAANQGRVLQEIHTTTMTTTTTTTVQQQEQQNQGNGQAAAMMTTETATSSNYVLMDEMEANNNSEDLHQESSPLMSHLSVDAASSTATEQRRITTRRRHRQSCTKSISARHCTWLYYISVLLVLCLLALVIVFFPKRPVYNVCNDAVAWKHIFTEISHLHLNLGFQILISLSNPNRLDIALENATGSFTFEGRHVGTFEIPPDYVDSMSITDVMLITHVTPSKTQAVKMANAYLIDHDLILTAEFDATLRVPALFNYTKTVHVENITVYVNELSDRSLCNCPTWDDEKNRSAVSLNQNIFNLF